MKCATIVMWHRCARPRYAKRTDIVRTRGNTVAVAIVRAYCGAYARVYCDVLRDVNALSKIARRSADNPIRQRSQTPSRYEPVGCVSRWSFQRVDRADGRYWLDARSPKLTSYRQTRPRLIDSYRTRCKCTIRAMDK